MGWVCACVNVKAGAASEQSLSSACDEEEMPRLAVTSNAASDWANVGSRVLGVEKW